jgi:hypothetical protein
VIEQIARQKKAGHYEGTPHGPVMRIDVAAPDKAIADDQQDRGYAV